MSQFPNQKKAEYMKNREILANRNGKSVVEFYGEFTQCKGEEKTISFDEWIDHKFTNVLTGKETTHADYYADLLSCGKFSVRSVMGSAWYHGRVELDEKSRRWQTGFVNLIERGFTIPDAAAVFGMTTEEIEQEVETDKGFGERCHKAREKLQKKYDLLKSCVMWIEHDRISGKEMTGHNIGNVPMSKPAITGSFVSASSQTVSFPNSHLKACSDAAKDDSVTVEMVGKINTDGSFTFDRVDKTTLDTVQCAKITTIDPDTCTCPMSVIMSSGCKCGQMKRERGE